MEVVAIVIEFEEKMNQVAREALDRNQTLVVTANFQMETKYVNSSNSTNLTLSNVNYYLEEYVSLYYVVAGQFLMKKSLANYLIDDAQSGIHGDVSFVIATESIPCLSITGYNVSGSAITDASVDFTWYGNDVIFEEVASIVRNTNDEVRIRSVIPRCRFIDTVTQRFSERGCRTVIALSLRSFTPVRCECTHTTVFAILLSVSARVVPFGVKVSFW